MREGDVQGYRGFPRLKRASYTGYVVILAWLGVAGGVTLLISGTGTGWFPLLLGLLVVASRFTPAFRSLMHRDVTWGGFPVLTFLANGLLILLVLLTASVFARDPFVLYNRGNTLGLVLWLVATALSIGTLVANTLAYRRDRKEHA